MKRLLVLALCVALAGCAQPPGHAPPSTPTATDPAGPLLGVDECYPGYMMDCMEIPDAKHIWESYGWSQLSNFTDEVGYDLGARDGWAAWYRGFGSDQSHEHWALDLAKAKYYVLPRGNDPMFGERLLFGDHMVYGNRVLVNPHVSAGGDPDTYHDYFVALWEPETGGFTNVSTEIPGDLVVIGFDGTWALLGRRDRAGEKSYDRIVLNIDTREWRVAIPSEVRTPVGVPSKYVGGDLVDGKVYYEVYNATIDGYLYTEQDAATGVERVIRTLPNDSFPAAVFSDEYIVLHESLEGNLGYTAYDRRTDTWLEITPNVTRELSDPEVGGEWIVFEERNPTSDEVTTTNFWAYHIPTGKQVLLTPPQEDYLMYIYRTDGEYVLMAGQSNRDYDAGVLQEGGEQIYLKPLPDPYA